MMQVSGATRAPTGWLLAATPIVVLLTHYAAVLPHEFTHSFVAWALGIKADPLNIDWGGTSLLNLLLLVHIDENVDYTAALAAGQRWQVALTAFAGAGFANAGLYLLSRRLIVSRAVSSRPFLAYALFWFLAINLANLYDYVPLRVFAADGDVWHFRLATGMSPWLIYAVGGYLVLWALVDFYRVVLPRCLAACGFDSGAGRAVVLMLATALMFGYFAIPGLEEADPASQLLARSSLLAIPVLVATLWRRIVTPASSGGPTSSPRTSRTPAARTP